MFIAPGLFFEPFGRPWPHLGGPDMLVGKQGIVKDLMGLSFVLGAVGVVGDNVLLAKQTKYKN